ncbi:hypothetical protein C4544_07455 [candidate division WS5 bacterium]|uniref:Uncharacterized protein n=1 Tax=candidate division WS5 bacterium TaxID=2093353 RepID=A0A419DA28_9BACT|nr:MAG: hypothetical protein C4544_07455 [candidate division WS5 bacterium]
MRCLVVNRSLDTLIIFSVLISVSYKSSGGIVVAENASPAMPSVIFGTWASYRSPPEKPEAVFTEINYPFKRTLLKSKSKACSLIRNQDTPR